MTVSVKAPTSTTGSIQLNGSDVLTIDSSGNLTVPNNLNVTGTPPTPAANSIGATELNVSGAGTVGQVLTSDADGSFSWADARGGIWEEVENVTFSTTGFWNWRPDLYTSRSSYKLFRIILENIIPVTDNVNFGYQWLLNGSFNSAGASGVAWDVNGGNGVDAYVVGGSGSGSGYYYGFEAVGSAANEFGICAEINCYNFDSDSSDVMIHGTGVFLDSAGRCNSIIFSMLNKNTNTVNGIRFVFSSNDIESGTARVLGLKV